MIITQDQVNEVFGSVEEPKKLTPEEMNQKREELRKQAMKFLYDNQECYVAQWILQNPFANPEDYALKFTYNDKSLMGYSVTMEKLPNV